MSYRTRLILLLTLLVLTFAGGIIVASRQAHDQRDSERGSGGHKKAPTQLESVALNMIAKRTGSSLGELQITASTTLDLPLTGKVAHQFSIRNKNTGVTHEVVIDDRGTELDRAMLLQNERAVQVQKFGKLDRALMERLDALDESELVLVEIQVVEPDDEDSLPSRTR